MYRWQHVAYESMQGLCFTERDYSNVLSIACYYDFLESMYAYQA